MTSSGAFVTGTLEDARCVLNGLRDGKPGQYTFDLVSDGATWEGEFYRLNALADGSVVQDVSRGGDIGATRDFSYYSRKDSAFFDGCLALEAGAELASCLRDWRANPIFACPLCPAP
jgi:hypothetical protein